MPRVRTTESEDVVVVKKPRASRARSVDALGDTDSGVPRKRAPRKAAPKPVVEVTPDVLTTRKAPTPIAAERRQSVRSTRVLVAVLMFCLVLTGTGVLVGLFDRGAIDVVAVVNERNEKISRGEVRDEQGQPVTITVPVQTDTRPNGGLKIADPADAPAVPTPAPAVIASTTATTTATTTTSSTDSVPTDPTTPPVTPTPAS